MSASLGTLPVSELCEADFDWQPTLTIEKAYGYLLPLFGNLPPIPLNKDEIKVGRCRDESPVDISLSDYRFPKANTVKSFSKVHFHLVRQTMPVGSSTFLKDFSSNGTLVCGSDKQFQQVGKGKSRILCHGDRIALSREEFCLFVYVDKVTGTEDYPVELSAKYIMTGNILGSGAMGTVELAFLRQPGAVEQQFAVKKIRNGGVSQLTRVRQNPDQVANEIRIMQSIDHPNVIRVMDVYDAPGMTYIAMECVQGGELFDRIIEDSRGGLGLGEGLGKLYFYFMLKGVEYLHEKMITHRDLKPENMLLCEKDVDETLLKISDFGLSKFFDEASMRTNCGTPTYQAPEVLRSSNLSPSYTSAVDMWSLGVILFVSISGYPPFSKDYQDMPLAQQIANRRLIWTARWNNISKSARNMVESLLSQSPRKRLTAKAALAHPWMQDEAMLKTARRIVTGGGAVAESPSRKRPRDSVEHMDVDTPTAPAKRGPRC